MTGAVLLLLLFAGAWAAWRWLKNRLEDARTTRREYRRLAATRAAVSRPSRRQRLLALLPGAFLRRWFHYRPARRPRPFASPVRVARAGLLGRWATVRPDRHVLLIGLTGSGKSSLQRVLALHALRSGDAVVEVWDVKRISALRDHAAHADVFTTVDAIAERIHVLYTQELTEREDAIISGGSPPHRLVLIDEVNTLLTALPAAALTELTALVEQGREPRVHFCAASQHPLAETLPTRLRSQFRTKVCFHLQSERESHLVFPGAPGWRPHQLHGPGACLVQHADGRQRGPVEVQAVWLSEERFRELAHPYRRPVDLRKACVRACVSPEGTGQVHSHTPARTPARTLTDAQSLALSALGEADALTGAQLARELGTDRFRARDVLTQLTAKGLVARTEDGAYALVRTPSPADADADKEN